MPGADHDGQGPVRPTPTHLSLAALFVALAFLGTLSYVGSRDPGNQAAATPVSSSAQPLLAPAADGVDQASTSRLVHPLVGLSRAALDAELGPPEESYTSGTYSFLSYTTMMNRYQVVLRGDTVVEVSQIN